MIIAQGRDDSWRIKRFFVITVGVFLFSWLFMVQPCNAQNSAEQTAKFPKMKGATYVGTETCAFCHEEEFKEYKLSTHARLDVKDVADANAKGVAVGCEMCHGPGSIHAEEGGGKGTGTIINPRHHPEACFACHSDKKMEFRLPYRHPVLEGKMSCSDCHKAHGSEVRPWTATSMEDVNEACFK